MHRRALDCTTGSCLRAKVHLLQNRRSHRTRREPSVALDVPPRLDLVETPAARRVRATSDPARSTAGQSRAWKFGPWNWCLVGPWDASTIVVVVATGWSRSEGRASSQIPTIPTCRRTSFRSARRSPATFEKCRLRTTSASAPVSCWRGSKIGIIGRPWRKARLCRSTHIPFNSVDPPELWNLQTARPRAQTLA